MLKIHGLRVALFAFVGWLAFTIYALFAPKLYEARTEVVVGTAVAEKYAPRPAIPDDVLELLEQGEPQSYVTELEVLRGEGVFDAAVKSVSQKEGRGWLDDPIEKQALYTMYNADTVPDSSDAAIRVRASDPDTAVDLANAIVEEFNATRQSRATTALDAALEDLNAQIPIALDRVNAAQKQLKSLHQGLGAADIGQKASTLVSEQVQLKATLSGLQSQYEGAQREVDSLQMEASSVPRYTNGDATRHDPQIDVLRTQLSSLQAQEAQLMAQYSDGAPDLKQVREEIKTINRLLAQTKKQPLADKLSQQTESPVYQWMKQELAHAVAQRDSLASQVKSVQSDLDKNAAQLTSLPAQQDLAIQYQREFDIADQQYRQLLTTKNDLDHKLNAPTVIQIGGPVVMDPDPRPVAPSLPKYMIFGFLGGAILGLCFSLTLESLRLRVYDSGQVAELTGVPIVASLPMSRKAALNRPISSFAKNRDVPIAEGIKYLAFTGISKGTPKFSTVMFTEVQNSAGATSAAVQYAIALSQTGLRVVLVDANVRSRTLTHAFEMPNLSGFSDIIERTMLPGSDEKIAQDTVHPNLKFCPAGSGAETAITASSSQTMLAVLQNLKESADVVIFSVAPCDQFADAARLAALMDEVYLVVTAYRTSLPDVPRARALLVSAGASNVQVIMTGGPASTQQPTLGTSQPLPGAVS
jgi:uncharacterized protein involved in exopolysaccharide biosynthesis/Mrp family chromosome partitioning ATPase